MAMPPDAERGPLGDRPSTTTTKLDPGSHTDTTPAAGTLAAIHGGERRAAAWLRKVLDSDAYQRGIARANADRANAPTDASTVKVSVEGRTIWDDREDVYLCRSCGWARPGHCTCEAVAR